MTNIFKRYQLKATLALAIVSIAFAELSDHSPEDSRTILVIAATALGIAALYPMYLLMHEPRRYKIVKVEQGYETVYIVRYKGYLWWYDATLSNGKTIAFKSMDEAMQYIRENVVTSMINNKSKKKSAKRKAITMYDSNDQLNDEDTANYTDPSDGGRADTSHNAQTPSMPSNYTPQTDNTPRTSDPSIAQNANTNSPANPSHVSETSVTQNAEPNSTPEAPKQKDNPPIIKTVSQTTSFLNNMATKQQKEDDAPSHPDTPETTEKAEGEPAHVPTESEHPDEEQPNNDEDAPDKTDDNNPIPTPSEITETDLPTPALENSQNTANTTSLSGALYDVVDSYNSKQKRKSTNKKVEDTGEDNEKEMKNPQPETFKESEEKEEEPKGNGNGKGIEDDNPKNPGKIWTQIVGETRLSQGRDPQLVTSSLTMIHQHRILRQEKMEASQNADGDAPDGKTPPSTAQGKEIQNNPNEGSPKEEVPTKAIKPGKPTAEQRYLKSKQKAAQKQKSKQTSLYDMEEFYDTTKDNPQESPATDTANDNAQTAPTDSPKDDSSSSGGHKIVKKPESSPVASQQPVQDHIPQKPEVPDQDTPQRDFPNGSEDTTEEPPDEGENPPTPIRQPSEEVTQIEEDEVDYGYTENDTTPNVIIVTATYPAENDNNDKDDLPI